METLEHQLAALSPDQRRLVEHWLRRASAPVDSPVSASAIPRRRTTDPSPLSFAQQRLWFLNQLEPGSPAYNLRTAIRLIGQLDVELLERSLNAIVERHEVLRTTFPAANGQPCQLITPTLRIPLPLDRLDHLPPAEQETELQRLALAETEQPFDLAAGPLLRARLLRLAAGTHVLLLTMHHIISDGWSQGIQLRELAALYAAFAQGQPSPLPALPIQYADYAGWQRRWLQGERVLEQVRFWTEQLGPAAHVLDLPTDRPRPPVATYRGRWTYVTVPAALLEALQALSRREGVTLFMTLLAALAGLLHRYSDQTDLVIGTPVAGRTRNELEGLIGCFVNMLALRMDLAGTPTLRELLRRVRATTLGAYAHQELPFEQLVEELHLERDLSRNPVFQVMFALQNTPLPELHGPGLRLEPMEVSSTTSVLDLSLYARELQQALLIRVEYNTDLFDGATIERMLGQFQVLLEAIVAAPDQRVHALPLMTVAERRQLLVEWNATGMPYPCDEGLATLFQAQATHSPDRVALIDGQLQITYAVLQRRVGQLARYLCGLGVGPETLVGLCLERSPDLIVGLLGIVQAGGAYVPLDPAYPPARLALMLEESQPVVLITLQEPRTKNQEPTLQEQRTENKEQNGPKPDGQKPRTKNQEPTGVDSGSQFSPALSEACPALRQAQEPRSRRVEGVLDSEGDFRFSGHVVDLARDWPMIEREQGPLPAGASHREQLVYVAYTSGSTGQPKGVLGLQGGILNRLAWAWQTDPFTAGEVGSHKTSLNFLDSVGEIFGPLLQGVPVALFPDGTVKDLPRFVAALGRACVTRLVLVPSLLEALLDTHPDLAWHLPHLRTWTSSGEALPAGLAQRFHTHLPQARLLNLYGSSEVAADSLWHMSAPDLQRPTVPIGRPLANTQVYVLDADIAPVPIGVPGEVYIGGDGLARGYLHRPDLTAERFIPNPFGDQRLEIRDWRLLDAETSISNLQSLISMGTRLYWTGDRARFLPDGALEYLGRGDQQVKIRGVRIELGEVEAALRRHPAVGLVVVIACADRVGDQRLIAYIVPNQEPRTKNQEPGPSSVGSRFSVLGSGEGVLGSGELRVFLKATLPEYMIPSAFVLLERLPLTPNGKVDRRALPDPDPAQATRSSALVAPRTPAERALAEIWADVLGLEQVGIHDNFFDLGGHSLKAAQMIGRVRDVLRVDLLLRSLFETPTITSLAERIETIQQMAQREEVPAGAGGGEFEEGEI